MTNVNTAMRVLLVDDHPDTLMLQAMLLRKVGYEVHAVATVAAAIQAAAERTFDLLISDIRLPDGSGIELMEHLNAEHNLTGIAVTGVSDDAERARAASAGFAEYLLKPILPERLLECVAQFARTDGK